MLAAAAMKTAEILLAPATEDDREFSYQVKKMAEGAYITVIWGWDEERERQFHAKDWENRRPDVIKYRGERIGTMYVRDEEGAIWIRQFFILPEFQNRGIGSELLRRALAEADRLGCASNVAFLKGNPVESLYRRFGFRSAGHRDKFCFMERKPQKGSQQAAGPDL